MTKGGGRDARGAPEIRFRPSFGLIGAGRAAQALALALAPHAAELVFHDVADAALERAAAVVARARAARDLGELAADCDLIAIAVTDDAIGGVVADLAAVLPRGAGAFVFHISGRCGAAVLGPLRAAGAAVAAIHPVMTFVGDPVIEAARMRGAPFAVTAPDEPTRKRALDVVAALGGRPILVGEADRALYHAALCHAANHLVTLIAGGVAMLKAAGVGEPSAVLQPLVQAALDNVLERGLAAMSGPLLRGDAETIANHLDAMAQQAPEVLPDYAAMARGTLRALAAADEGRKEMTAGLLCLLEAHDPTGVD